MHRHPRSAGLREEVQRGVSEDDNRNERKHFQSFFSVSLDRALVGGGSSVGDRFVVDAVVEDVEPQDRKC